MTVWVDPLDGTLSYVNNELDSVTTLIGKNLIYNLNFRKYSKQYLYIENNLKLKIF